MTSNRSFSEGALLRDGLRRNLWCIVLSALGFLMTLTLPALMQMQRALECQRQIAEGLMGLTDAAVTWKNSLDGVSAVLGGGNFAVKFAFLALAVVCGISAYSYLHQRQRVDFYHALPVSRTRQFLNRFAVGILCVAPVYLIVLAFTVGCAYAMGFGEAVRWGYLLGSAASCLAVFLVTYAQAALAAILCGNTIISLLLLLWLLFGPIAACELGAGLGSIFYGTYSRTIQESVRMLRLAPAVQIFTLNGLQYTGSGFDAARLSASGLLLVYLAAAALLTALCLWLYRIRKSERAGMALAFEPLKAPLKIVMCLLAGTAVGLLLYMMAGSFWFWPGLIIGAVLFHFLIEVIYAFDFHAIFRKPLHLAAILVVLIGGCLLLRADAFGYDSYLPAEDKIAAADLGRGDSAVPALSSPENIRAVRRIAAMGIEEDEKGVASQQTYDADADEAVRFEYVSVLYRLNSGRIVGRNYTIPASEELKTLWRQITSSTEYKRCKWPLFTFDPKGETGEERPAIEVVNEQGYNARGVISDEGQVLELLDTLRQEALARPDTATPALSLNMGYQENWESGRAYLSQTGNVAVTDADTKTLALIREFTGVTPEPLTADDVRSIEIASPNNESWLAEVTDPTDVGQLLKDAVNCDALTWSEETCDSAFDELGNIRVTAISRHGANSYTLRYPLGKTPTALLEKYSAEARAAQPEGAVAQDGAAAADPVLPW